MALITLPITVSGAENPNADSRIGAFDTVKHWWTLNAEAISGLTLKPRKGTVALTASAALPATTEINGFSYPNWTNVSGQGYFTGTVPRPGAIFSLVCAQSFTTSQKEPFGLSLAGSPNVNPFIRPAMIPSSSNPQISVSVATSSNNAYSFTGALKRATGVLFPAYYVFDLTDLAAATAKFSPDGITFTALGSPSTTITQLVGQTISANLGLTLGAASTTEMMDGPVLDFLVIEGDVSAQTSLLAALNDYFTSDLFGA